MQSRKIPSEKNMPPKHLLSRRPISQDPLGAYLKQISAYPLLDLEEERKLAMELKKSGDLEIAKKLVLHNLRLVVKIALEYRSAWQNTMDLIQEGNIGLMKAVSKYDPEKGAKLSYYASWWIRSYVLKFILDNFRLVKIGTTNEQKKLFYNLLKEKNRLISLGEDFNTKTIANNLGVSEKSGDPDGIPPEQHRNSLQSDPGRKRRGARSQPGGGLWRCGAKKRR